MGDVRAGDDLRNFPRTFDAGADGVESIGKLVEQPGVSLFQELLEGFNALCGADAGEDFAGQAAGFSVFFLKQFKCCVFHDGTKLAECVGGDLGLV